ncbi:hypothetical protein K443DRAFT_596950 [Laccaria amethystina LaAM-08-1]|uniref:Uncharacterized protein n=1 Tax=Laccaria amethystina LaAM-08-1 TaxID=1095629 RepID=A0A0C9XGR1_9AGAR|nr:hypothetical protein K443DRAFT_596950 [Laccaria amethystina LaAM-08-1]
MQLTLALEAESDESTLTPSSLDVPRDALEPSRCFGSGTGASNKAPAPPLKKSSSSSSNSKGTLPDNYATIASRRQQLRRSDFTPLLILPKPSLIPSPNPAVVRMGNELLNDFGFVLAVP